MKVLFDELPKNLFDVLEYTGLNQDPQVEKDLAASFEEFEEDFEAKDAKYQLWLLGYDADQNITDFEFLVNESKDPVRMIAQAKQYIEERKYLNRSFPQDVAYLEVIVETVVDVEGYEENVGTLFDEYVKIK
jgi:hypothetical protein